MLGDRVALGKDKRPRRPEGNRTEENTCDGKQACAKGDQQSDSVHTVQCTGALSASHRAWEASSRRTFDSTTKAGETT